MSWSRRARLAARAPIDTDAAFALQRDVSGALTRAIAPGVVRPGGITMRGKAAKHFALLGRTLVVRADPAAVAPVVGAALAEAGSRLRPVADLVAGEAAAFEAESMFGAFPRFVVRASPVLPGITEVGTVRFAMSMRFPQGGVFTDRAVTACTQALADARLTPAEFRREFSPDPELAPGGVDGVWVAGPLALVQGGG